MNFELPFTVTESNALKACGVLALYNRDALKTASARMDSHSLSIAELQGRLKTLETLVDAIGEHLKAHCVSIETLVNEVYSEKTNGTN